MKRLVLISFILTGCATHIRQHYDLEREYAEAQYAERVEKLNVEAESATIGKDAPLIFLDAAIIRRYDECGKRSPKQIQACTSAAFKEVLPLVSSRYWAHDHEKVLNALDALSKEEKYQLAAVAVLRLAGDQRAVRLLSFEVAMEELMRVSHNEGIEEKRSHIAEKLKLDHDVTISRLNYRESSDVANHNAQVSASLNQLSNNLNQINTQNQLRDTQNQLYRIEGNQQRLERNQRQLMIDNGGRVPINMPGN